MNKNVESGTMFEGEFQFPSNGKARVNAVQYAPSTLCQSGFQFPSNGKARVNKIGKPSRFTVSRTNVSIPFKRESTCELFGAPKVAVDIIKFQFPSNGKARVNEELTASGDNGRYIQFQFPSNGKARVNCYHRKELRVCTSVSIPFKRESTCELSLSSIDPTSISAVSIPFKRESTCERENGCRHSDSMPVVSIPFKRESTCELVVLQY